MDRATLTGLVRRDLIPFAQALLKRKYGTRESCLRGCLYHNHDHGWEVAVAARRIASGMCEIRRVRRSTLVLAPAAGWLHDAEQGDEHEARSARIAVAAMRARGIGPRYRARVRRMIEATKVVEIEGTRIIQAADPNNLEEAILGDADLSPLGGPDTYRGMLWGMEKQHVDGLIELPSPMSPTDGLVEPDLPAMIDYLEFNSRLAAEHEYMLPVTRQLFPHQRRNSDEYANAGELLRSGRITFTELLIDAKWRSLSPV